MFLGLANLILINLLVVGLIDLLMDFNSILSKFKGTKNLNFTVFDIEENLKLNLPSRSFKVDISNELIEVLNKEQIHFKLN